MYNTSHLIQSFIIIKIHMLGLVSDALCVLLFYVLNVEASVTTDNIIEN